MSNSQKISKEFNISEEEAIKVYRGIAKLISLNYALLAEHIYSLSNDLEGLILDLGSGLGNLATEIAKRFTKSEVWGLDISKEMLLQAESLAKEEDLSNLKFKLMDVHKLDFSPNSVDLIVSHGSLHHWESPVEVFREIYRVLKPSRFAFIVDLKRDAPKSLIEEITSFLTSKEKEGFLNSLNSSYLPAEIENLLGEADIRNFEITHQKFSRKVIMNNWDKIKDNPYRSDRFNSIYVNVMIKK
ncbi:MAG: class I SAM-dependent methyltransferase [Candidatus Omnitrophica bacterium]|nr:class I SAM-dependent methyltransferase [Candidatus Omnitrophota bacterium]